MSHVSVTEVINVDTAEEFLQQIRRSHTQWLDNKHGPECGWFFRGQPDASLTLLPAAFRPASNDLLTSLREAIQRDHASTDWRKLLGARAKEVTCSDAEFGQVAIDALTHAGAVRLFMAVAHEVRRAVPFSDLLHHVFNNQRTEFRQYFCGEFDGNPHSVFAVAQHHGVPTQFLDWTLDPLIAAYFAADKADAGKADRLALWAIRRDLFDCDWSLCRFSVGAGITPFLDAQAGLFTWSRRAYIDRANRGRYVPFDELVDQAAAATPLAALEPPPYLKKVTLPTSRRDDLLRLLWTERVTPAHLMPTFDHVTRAVEQKVRWL